MRAAAFHGGAIALLLIGASAASRGADWLVHPIDTRARVSLSLDGDVVTLSNGLVRRQFVISPNWATIELAHERTGELFLRAPAAEAELRVRLIQPTPDERTPAPLCTASAPVGGLLAPKRLALFDPTERSSLALDPRAFRYAGYAVSEPEARFRWRPAAWTRPPEGVPWPPRGVHLAVRFAPPPGAGACLSAVRVTLHYELYDGLPLLAKWVEVGHGASAPSALGREPSALLVVDDLASELVRVQEGSAARVRVETDFVPRMTEWARASGLGMAESGPYAARRMDYAAWHVDAPYSNNSRDGALQGDPAWPRLLLRVAYPLGPARRLPLGASCAFMRVHVLLHDSDEAERQSLARRRVLRTLAPQLLQAPLYFALSDASSPSVRRAVRQAAAVGLDAVVLSFGSGFDPTSPEAAYERRIRADVEYARALGVAVGGYVLLQNPPNMSAAAQCIDPDSGAPAGIASFATRFHADFRARVLAFFTRTGLKLLETDGPYEGAACAPTALTGYAELANSQLAQFEATVGWYRQLREETQLYLTVPDPYWLTGGTNKETMGYTDAWTRTIPRDAAGSWEHLTTGRMYLYDGSRHKPPSAGWVALNLERIEALPAGSGARLELLEWALASYVGQGNLPSARGTRLFPDGRAGDAEAELWRRWVAHLRAHAAVLGADVLHVRRPSGRAAELSVHVDPARGARERALGFAFNPTSRALSLRGVRAPLHYAGLAPRARVHVSWHGSLRSDEHARPWHVPPAAAARLDARSALALDNVSLAPRSFLCFVVTDDAAPGHQHGGRLAAGE